MAQTVQVISEWKRTPKAYKLGRGGRMVQIVIKEGGKSTTKHVPVRELSDGKTYATTK